MRLIDSHCHLDAPEFDVDRSAVLERARAAGVMAQVVPAVSAASFPALAALAQQEPDVHPCYGLHPMYLAEHRDEHLAEVRRFLRSERAVAVGECGLDFFVEGLDPERQRALFLAQLRIAREFELPVVLHARRAVDEVIATLRKVGGLRGVVHSYSGSEEQARRLYQLGFFLGVGGPVTYERAQRLRRVVATMPLEHLLVETDAPDQPDSAHRGERNEPAHLRSVVETIAALRGVTAREIAAATSANAIRLFGGKLAN
jgi:TatD DNase family protein